MYAKFSEQLTFLTSWYAYLFDSFIVHILDYMKSIFNENAILVTIFWNFSFSTFHYLFNLPQVKQNLISQENILYMSCFRSYRVTQDKNSHKLNIQSIYQGFHVLPSFAWLLGFVPNIMTRIAVVKKYKDMFEKIISFEIFVRIQMCCIEIFYTIACLMAQRSHRIYQLYNYLT